MPQSRMLSIGMDGPTASIAVASVAQAHGAAVVSCGTVGTQPWERAKRRRPLQSQSPQLVLVDEAGPCGSWLARSLMHKGDGCGVVAPSWMPHKAGARVTTARREARPLARRMRAGARTPGSGPAVDAAALRDLRRARAETLRALKAAPWRRPACVRRPALRAPGRAPREPSPPALAPRGALSHTGAAAALAGRRPDHHRTDCALAPSGASTPRAGPPLALSARRRGSPGAAARAPSR